MLFNPKSRMKLLLLSVTQLLLHWTQLTRSLENLSKCQLPSSLAKNCICDKYFEGISLTCNGLNATSDLPKLEHDIAKHVIRLDISEGKIPCVELNDFSPLQRLKELRITQSQLNRVICRQGGEGVLSPLPSLASLTSLDLSDNQLTTVDESLTSLTNLRAINFSNNLITHIRPIFSAFKHLQSVDVSHNQLSDNFNKLVLKGLPSSVEMLDISGELWKIDWRW